MLKVSKDKRVQNIETHEIAGKKKLKLPKDQWKKSNARINSDRQKGNIMDWRKKSS